jgi:hypothetical protein
MDTKPEGLSVTGERVNFRSLSLEGVRGRVRATLTEKQVSFESKSGHALDIKLDAVKRVHHHHTTLVPGWLAAVGLILIWVAWRGVTGKMQALLGAAGIVLSTAHYITRRPTLTIDTNANDCHTVFGPDIAMMRLCSLIQRIQNGMNLGDAKASVDAMVSDSEYPRYEITQELEIVQEPVEIFPSPVIPHFIDIMEPSGSDDILQAEIVSPSIPIADLDLPLWEDEVETPVQQIPQGLLSRSKENMSTQRNQIIQNGWQTPERPPAYNQVHRGNHAGTSYDMVNQRQPHEFSIPRQNPEPTPIPTNFLPSFVGANGVHVPGVIPEEFIVPDSPLHAPPESEPTQSLVASARKKGSIEATPVAEVQESQKERYPGVNKLSTKPKSRRLVSSRSGRKNRAAKRSILSELVKPIGRAGAFSRNLIKRRGRTADSLRLQAEHTRQEQLASSIQELAKSNGGDVSDEEVSEMISHLSPATVIPSSFSELVSTGSKNKGIDDVDSLPKIGD